MGVRRDTNNRLSLIRTCHTCGRTFPTTAASPFMRQMYNVDGKKQKPVISALSRARTPVTNTYSTVRQKQGERRKRPTGPQRRTGGIIWPTLNRNAKGQGKGIGPTRRQREKTADTSVRKDSFVQFRRII